MLRPLNTFTKVAKSGSFQVVSAASNTGAAVSARTSPTASPTAFERAVRAEREEQDAKWGEQNHPDYDPHDIPAVMRGEYAFRADRWKEINARRAERGCEVKHRLPAAPCTAWDGILLEEVYEALAEENPDKLRAELVQVAAVAQAWAEAIERRGRR